ncbi:MAG: flagellar basal body rod protein FlgB [Candidatus Cloacimonadota bacterium]|nr:MAG: flagellar basal body rod protein FlgB [Candidatus Cloacimonadota bacterium]
MISKLLFHRTSVPDLEKSLNAYSARQKAVTNNIANANTPGYKAKRIAFEEDYQKYLDRENQLKGTITHKKHIPFGMRDFNRIKNRVVLQDLEINDSGINNVDVDKEMALLAENNIRYEMNINLIKKKLHNLKSSIKGR